MSAHSGAVHPDDIDYSGFAADYARRKIPPASFEEFRVVDLVCAAGITPEPISWLWPGWLAGGKLHVLAGPAGTGKTTIAIALAATVSTGGAWPDGTRCQRPGHVLIWSAEDGVADTLVPRLRAAGADLTKISFVTRTHDEEGSRSFDPAFDIPLLAAECRRLTDVRMLIVDPVVSAVAANSHNNAETRRSLQPLVDFGEHLGAAVLGITHFSKGTKGREPLERVTGSLAFGALARIVLGAMKGDDDQRLLVRVKSNIGPDGGGFNYALEYPDIGDGIIGSHVVWGSAVDGDARTLLAESEADDDEDVARSERADAVDWLREVLADGPVSAKDLKRWAGEAGHAWRTVERAKKAAGVVPQKSAFAGGWRWSLTPKTATDPQDGQSNWVASFDDVGRLRGNPARAEDDRLAVAVDESLRRMAVPLSASDVLAYLSDWPAGDVDEVVANPGLLDAVVLGLGAPRSAAWSRQGASPTLILGTDISQSPRQLVLSKRRL